VLFNAHLRSSIRFPPFGLFPKWFCFPVIRDGFVLLSDSARICLSLCVVFAPTHMAISSFSLGMVVNECQPSKLVDAVVYGLLLWHELILALEVHLLEIFSHSKFLLTNNGLDSLVSVVPSSLMGTSICLIPSLKKL